jgi:hypothetical protein
MGVVTVCLAVLMTRMLLLQVSETSDELGGGGEGRGEGWGEGDWGLSAERRQRCTQGP